MFNLSDINVFMTSNHIFLPTRLIYHRLLYSHCYKVFHLIYQTPQEVLFIADRPIIKP